MILESCINDDSVLILELAENWKDPTPEVNHFGAEPTNPIPQVKRRICKGDIVDVPDRFWGHPQISGALKQNLVKLLGNPPETHEPSGANQEDRVVMLVNTSDPAVRLAFECLRDYVDPGQNLRVPESKMEHKEIQNALAMGMLHNPEDDASPRQPGPPAELEEVKVLTETPPEKREQPRIKSRAKTKTKTKAKSSKKSKPEVARKAPEAEVVPDGMDEFEAIFGICDSSGTESGEF
jgi:hypothetical protein